jgi:glycosyltransferase involved in cell wall biosynthesis
VVADETITAVLVHYLNCAVGYESVWAGTEKPIFVHCHGYDFNLDCRRHDSPEQLLFKPGFRERAQRVCDRCTIIANSQHSARMLEAEFHPPRLKVKPLGVPVPDTCPQHADRTSGLEVLYLGRLCDCKGPDLTIRAFERACTLGFDGRLTLAGDGELRMMCELLQRRSPVAERIRLTGIVNASTAEELRRGADLFTLHNCHGPLTHETEAYGVSVIEAMAAGLPVITGRSGGVCETVADGETGVLVEPGNIEEHAQALVRLARDPTLRRRMGQAGWRRVRDHFSVRQERAVLRGLLGLSDTPVDARAAEES